MDVHGGRRTLQAITVEQSRTAHVQLPLRVFPAMQPHLVTRIGSWRSRPLPREKVHNRLCTLAGCRGSKACLLMWSWLRPFSYGQPTKPNGAERVAIGVGGSSVHFC